VSEKLNVELILVSVVLQFERFSVLCFGTSLTVKRLTTNEEFWFGWDLD